MPLNHPLSPLAIGAVLMATPAWAEFRYDVGNGGSVLLYGQINPAFTSVDDGTQRYDNFADSATSNTRVGLRYTQPYGQNTFSFRFETSLGLPLTSEQSQTGSPNRVNAWRRQDLRHLDVSLRGEWGQVSFGQGSMAADGIAHNAASAVSAVLYQFTADGNAAFFFRTTAGALTPVTVESVFGDFDGARRGRLRYDSPNWNGFQVSVAHGQNVLADPRPDDWFSDIALRYDTEFTNGVELTAGMAYQYRDRPNAANTSSVIASATAMLPNGISLTAGYGTRTDRRPGRSDPSWSYGQIAYDRQFFNWGVTSVGIDYYNGRDFIVQQARSEAWGIGLLQEIEPINAEAYVTYRVHSYDTVAVDYQDIRSWLLGMRIRF